jgi:hypothetical protein
MAAGKLAARFFMVTVVKTSNLGEWRLLGFYAVWLL